MQKGWLNLVAIGLEARISLEAGKNCKVLSVPVALITV